MLMFNLFNVHHGQHITRKSWHANTCLLTINTCTAETDGNVMSFLSILSKTNTQKVKKKNSTDGQSSMEENSN